MKFHIFSIESSCDETSVAIITDQKKILSHITVNQENHNKFGGVVPEIASRAHLQILQTIIPRCFKAFDLFDAHHRARPNPPPIVARYLGASKAYISAVLRIRSRMKKNETKF